MTGLSGSSSDLTDELREETDRFRGSMSGALYESMLVVWTSSIGAEILFRIEAWLGTALVVWLLCSISRSFALLAAAISVLSFTRRVVKALDIDTTDIVAVWEVSLGLTYRLGERY